MTIKAQIDQSNGLDPEIRGMRELVAVLEPFDNSTRRRMLEWLIAYQAEIPVARIPSPTRGARRQAAPDHQ